MRCFDKGGYSATILLHSATSPLHDYTPQTTDDYANFFPLISTSARSLSNAAFSVILGEESPIIPATSLCNSRLVILAPQSAPQSSSSSSSSSLSSWGSVASGEKGSEGEERENPFSSSEVNVGGREGERGGEREAAPYEASLAVVGGGARAVAIVADNAEEVGG